jgi:protein-disulfide isomerase
MRQTLETGASVLMVIVAIIMLGVYLVDRRDIRDGGVGFVAKDWREHNKAGIWLGPSGAPIVLTEFLDFTCPHCKTLVQATDSLYRSFPSTVAIVFQYFPLTGRPYSAELATLAGVGDTEKFSTCLDRPLKSFTRIVEGRRIGDAEGVVGTPTLWLNGEVQAARSFGALIQAARGQGIELQ